MVDETEQVLSITENGYGKRTETDEYRTQTRGGKGVKAMNLTDKTGLLTGQMMVHEDEDILIITDDGTVIRTPVASISIQGRNTQGIRLMRVADESKVVCVARAEAEEETEDSAVNYDTPDEVFDAADESAEPVSEENE
jgi:DNA gyrase subunit A